MNLLGGLLELPGKLLGQSLKALTGQETQKKSDPPPPPPRENLQLSQELRESIGTANDLDSLQAPLAPMYGIHEGRYDYNPQGARVQKLFESQMTDFGALSNG